MLDISHNPLTQKHSDKCAYTNLARTLNKNISCCLRTSSGLTSKKRSKRHTNSLPNLKNIKLNSSLQNYPRPIVIKTKEFNRKSKPDLKIGLKDAKPLNLKEINVDGDKIFPPKEKNENKNNVF